MGVLSLCFIFILAVCGPYFEQGNTSPPLIEAGKSMHESLACFGFSFPVVELHFFVGQPNLNNQVIFLSEIWQYFLL